MKIDVTKVLKDFDDNPIMDVKNGETVEATIRMAIVNALLTPSKNDKGTEKLEKFTLAQRVYGDDEVDLNEDEIKLIKDKIGELFAPMVVGRIFELLKV